MANSNRHTRGRRGPEEEQSGLKRPTHFEVTEDYKSSARDLGVVIYGKLVAQGEAFKRDWLKPDWTDEDLYRRWGYKPLRGGPKGLKVMQVTTLKDYRVAFAGSH